MNARETAEDYPDIVARLSERWRIIVCAGGIQWVLQKRDAGKAPSNGWRGVSCHHPASAHASLRWPGIAG